MDTIMSLISRLFSRTPKEPLPELDSLLETREVPLDLPGLEVLRPDFEHLPLEQRLRFADALADLHRLGQPLPPPWLDAQYELNLQVVPTWLGEKEGFFHRPIAEGLSQRILVNGRPMPEPWPVLWLVSLEEVLGRALDHLREVSKHKPFEKLSSGIYGSRFEDGLDASRLLLPELWENLFPGQNHFVAAPTADCLLVAPQVLLPRQVDAILKLTSDPSRLLFATILQWVNHNLLPANLQDPHPIAQPQRELRQMDWVAAVAAQDEVLDPGLGKTGPLSTLRGQNGRTFTMATWQAGAPVILPETDLIAFVSKTGDPLGVFFRTTLPRIPEIKGEVVDIWGPRRVKYDQFPTPEQMEKLECFVTAEKWKEILAQSAEKARPAPRPQAARAAAPGQAPGQGGALPPHLRNAGLGVQDDA